MNIRRASGGGRKALPDDIKKKHKVELKFTDSDYATLMRKAEESKITVAELVRSTSQEALSCDMQISVTVKDKLVTLSRAEAKQLMLQLARQL